MTITNKGKERFRTEKWMILRTNLWREKICKTVYRLYCKLLTKIEGKNKVKSKITES